MSVPAAKVLLVSHTRIADFILKAVSLALYGFWCYLVGEHGWDSIYLVPLILIAGLLAILRLPPTFRVNAVLVGMALCISAYVSEFVLAVEDDLAPVQSRRSEEHTSELHHIQKSRMPSSA